MNGSPVYPKLQEHVGLWLRTWQSAFIPHDPGHGSVHFWFMQAFSDGHSELITHSGRQLGGIPI